MQSDRIEEEIEIRRYDEHGEWIGTLYVTATIRIGRGGRVYDGTQYGQAYLEEADEIVDMTDAENDALVDEVREFMSREQSQHEAAQEDAWEARYA